METVTTLAHSWENNSVNLTVRTLAQDKNTPSSNAGFVWLGGFKSDMMGTKAEAMVEQAATLECGSLRFDYSGHGQSGGEFIEGTISRWVDESLHVLTSLTKGPQILLGSSMGGWIALRLAQRLAELGESDRLAALLLIAPAPDFTRDLMEAAFTDEQKSALARDGFIEEISEYSDEPNIITKQLIDDGRNNLVLEEPLTTGCPVRILQGMKDPDVPYHHALKLVEALSSDDTSITLVKNGDHRLSRESDITMLKRSMKNILIEL